MIRQQPCKSCLISGSPSQGQAFPLLHYGLFRGDNFGYFVQTSASEVIAVDSPDGKFMLTVLRERGWQLKALLLTHAHHDHVVDLGEVLTETGCAFYKPAGLSGLPMGRAVQDGEVVEVEGLRVEVLETSGHSPMDLSYVFPELKLCFCGDSVFHNGCGRMFAGPASRFWHSLERLRALPDDFFLCCGHDYAADNALFRRQLFPDLPQSDLPSRPHGPLSLADQRQSNPFLNADDPVLAAALGLSAAQPAEVFKKLRELRNQL
ncbi:MBL fold metallo-hydrolase [Kiritimatiellota bacterium B12222]|nr:MBL fold metallo-hydrolase [Kiritimatiellota bacterium B12222]